MLFKNIVGACFTIYSIIIYAIVLALFFNNFFNLIILRRDNDDSTINDDIENKKKAIKDLFNYRNMFYFINKNECNRKFDIPKELSIDTNGILIDGFINASIIIIIIFIFCAFVNMILYNKKNIELDDEKETSLKDNFLEIFEIFKNSKIYIFMLLICLPILIIITIFIKRNYYNEELIKNIKLHYITNKDNNFLHNIIKREWDLITDNTIKDKFKVLLTNSSLHNIDETLKNIEKYDNLFIKLYYLCIFLQIKNDNQNNVFLIMSNILKTFDMKVEPCNITFLNFIGYSNYNSNNKINDKNYIIILPSLLQSKYLIPYGEKGTYDIKDELKDRYYDYSIIKDWLIQLETELGAKTPYDVKYLTNIMQQSSGIINVSIYLIFTLTLFIVLISLLFIGSWFYNIFHDEETFNISYSPNISKYLNNIFKSIYKNILK